MRFRNRIAFIFLSLIVAMVLLYGFLIRPMINDIRYHSEMSFLNSGTREELERYYCEQNCYPAALIEIRNGLLKHSYASITPAKEKDLEEMLNKFSYFTDRASYEISWEVVDRNTKYFTKEKGLRGKLILSELYINGLLSSRHEYK